MTETTILVVDDNRTIILYCKHLLENASYHVLIATNPMEALEILAQQKVDLLLADIRMPEMDGFEMISQAKQCQPDLPVLVMTGYASIENAIQALHRGVDGLILKPFTSTAEVLKAVERVLGERQHKRDAARLQAFRPLFDVTERLLMERSPQPLEILILNTISGLFQATFAGIYRANLPENRLETVRSMSPAGANAQPQARQPEALITQAIESGIPVLWNAHQPGCSGPEVKLLHEMGWETILVAPVCQNDSQLVFCASRTLGRATFTEADLEMFAILARQAAVAMENARLYSELKNNVQRVEESQRALIQAEKMAAVGRLMASMAHEINNPLQSVRNCLHLAARKGIDSTQRKRYLEMTDGELERLVNTVRRMLDFYRTGNVENQPVDVCEVVVQVLALLGVQLRELNIQVIVQSVGQPVPVLVIRDQIRQVIFNLLLNAMDVLEESHVVSGDATHPEPMLNPAVGPVKKIWVDLDYEGQQQVRVRIEDSGPGIPDEMRERIFEPFTSTKAHGTGLGLAVSYGIMERHQGRLTIIPSRYGTGACFEITLPVEIG